MATALFISTGYVKGLTTVHANVNDDLIVRCIKKAQDIYIHTCLGTDLYEAMETKVTNSTVAGDYLTLMNKIQPALAWFVVSDLVMEDTFKIMNKSVANKSSENAQPVDFETAVKISARYKDTAEWYLKRLNDYLCEYEDLYPEYDSNNTADKLNPSGKSFSSPIYLGGGDCNCNPYP